MNSLIDEIGILARLGKKNEKAILRMISFPSEIPQQRLLEQFQILQKSANIITNMLLEIVERLEELEGTS